MLVAVLLVLLLLSSPARVGGERCVSGLRLVNNPVTKIDLAKPMDHYSAVLECQYPLDLDLLSAVDKLTVQDIALCGTETLVPLDLEAATAELNGLHNSTADAVVPNPRFRVPGWDLATGRWHYVGQNHKFRCVFCQRATLKLELPDRAPVDVATSPRTTEDAFLVSVTSVEPRTSANCSVEEISEVRTALTKLLKPKSFRSPKVQRVPKPDRRSLKGDKLLLEFEMTVTMLKSVAESLQPTSLLDRYLVAVEDRSFCPREETVDADGTVTIWEKTRGDDMLRGAFQAAKNSSADLVLGRDCMFNGLSFMSLWSNVSFWKLDWKECLDDEAFVSEEIYKDFFGEDVHYKHCHQLERYTSEPINTTVLKTVTGIVNRQVNLTNNIDDVTALDLVNITANLVLDAGEDVFLAQAKRVYVLVAALEGKTPVLGLTLQSLSSERAGKVNITLDRTHTEKPRPYQRFAFSISDGLVSDHKRMMMFVYWMDMAALKTNSYRSLSFGGQYIEMTVALVLKSARQNGALNYGRYSEYFVDLTFRSERVFNQLFFFPGAMKCSAWNDQLKNWVTAGCQTLKAKRDEQTVCRCSAKHFALSSVSGVATARFALNRVLEYTRGKVFVDIFGDNTALIAFTVVECLLSALGLCSIVATAIAFKAWRKNTGHQILMHMMLALTCNLVLGFTTNFVHFDLESAGCLVLGVLRHYTFLAMFLWMLVLSGLQGKRLMTVAGAKAITHLILKTSVFAWGVPVLPIVVLLVWDIGFYRSDRFDRGYCYPEDLVFQLTVQTPVGIILFVNLLIFVAIVTHIFECRGGKKITKHSQNESAERLNKLKTSLFIFFLFGFTWVFHFLSELRVIYSDFLFEYLFLMTATSHVLVLALFFVVLQESTRKDWLGLLGKLRCGSKPVPVAPVQAARPAYQPQLPKGIANRKKQAKAAKDATADTV